MKVEFVGNLEVLGVLFAKSAAAGGGYVPTALADLLAARPAYTFADFEAAIAAAETAAKGWHESEEHTDPDAGCGEGGNACCGYAPRSVAKVAYHAHAWMAEGSWTTTRIVETSTGAARVIVEGKDLVSVAKRTRPFAEAGLIPAREAFSTLEEREEFWIAANDAAYLLELSEARGW